MLALASLNSSSLKEIAGWRDCRDSGLFFLTFILLFASIGMSFSYNQRLIIV